MQIFVKQPGMDSIKTEEKPTDTIASIKEQLGLSGAQFWLGRKFLKNCSTLEECGVQQGATINALQNNKVPGGFANRGHYQSAMKLKSGKIKVSLAHPELQRQSWSKKAKLEEAAAEESKEETPAVVPKAKKAKAEGTDKKAKAKSQAKAAPPPVLHKCTHCPIH